LVGKFKLEFAMPIEVPNTAIMRFSDSFYNRVLITLALIISTALTSFASIHEGGDVAKGEQLFNANCASCHKITNEVLAAPGLGGVDQRWAGKDFL
jgi:cytochrome c2